MFPTFFEPSQVDTSRVPLNNLILVDDDFDSSSEDHVALSKLLQCPRRVSSTLPVILLYLLLQILLL